MDAMKMLEDFCAAEPAPTRNWLAAERAKVATAIGSDDQTSPRRGTRFRWPMPARTTMIGAAAIAVVTALVVALTVPSGHAGPQPRTQTAAYVISHTEAALSVAAAENPVVHVHSSHANQGIQIGAGREGSLFAQQEDTWYYGPDSNGPALDQGFTAAGQPVYDQWVVQTPDVYTSTFIDSRPRIWWRTVQHVTPWKPPSGSALTCGYVQTFAINMDPTEWAADIRKSLSCGQFTASGTEWVDGVDAIKLTPVRPDIMTAVLWVDPSTYLPVRVAIEIRKSPGGSFVLNNIEDVQWLPPTAANLARLSARIPSGYVQVPAPPPAVCPRGSAAAVNKCFAGQQRAYETWYAKYLAPRL